MAYDRNSHEQFRRTLQGFAESLHGTEDPHVILNTAADSVAAIEDYNREAQRVFGEHSVELRCMIEMLSRTLVGLAQAGGHSVDALQRIRNQIETASRLDDIRLLRARLSESLKALSHETELQRQRTAKIANHAEQAAGMAAGQTVGEVDRISGLLGLKHAAESIAAHLGATSTFYAAVFLLERVDALNLRYGFDAGDKLLQAFSQLLVSSLSPRDEIYRWRGPAFVALLDRPVPIEGVRAELARFVPINVAQNVDLNGKSLQLKMSCAWAVLPLAQFELPEQPRDQIDRFILEHSQRQAG